MSAVATAPRTPQGAPPSSAMRAEPPSAPSAPLSTERRDSWLDEGSCRPGSSRWSRWSRFLSTAQSEGGNRCTDVARAAILVTGESSAPRPPSAVEEEVSEARERTPRYQDGIEGSGRREAAERRSGHSSCVVYGNPAGIGATRAAGSWRSAWSLKRRKGFLTFSPSNSGSDSSSCSSNASRSSRIGDARSGRPRAHKRDPRPETPPPKPSPPLPPVTSQEQQLQQQQTVLVADLAVPAAVCSFLETVTSDGVRFTEALCHLADALTAAGTNAVTLSAARAFTAMRTNWEGAEEELRALTSSRYGVGDPVLQSTPRPPSQVATVSYPMGGSTASLSTAAVSAVIAAITHAQSQDHLRLVEVLKLTLGDHAIMNRKLRQVREELAELRGTSRLRFSELEEDHEAELDVLRGTVRELEARVAALSAALASSASGGGGNGSPGAQHSSTAYSLPVTQPSSVGRGGCTFTGSVDGEPLSGSLGLPEATTGSGRQAAALSLGPEAAHDGHSAPSAAGGAGAAAAGTDGAARARSEMVHTATQTALSMDFIAGAYARNRSRGGSGGLSLTADGGIGSPTMVPDRSAGYGKVARRERDLELLELLVGEVEALRDALAATSAERNVLAEQRDRFLCQVESPQLNYRRRLVLASCLGNQTVSL